MRQKRPMASESATPRMAEEKSCCFREGFLAYPMMREPKTEPIPAPDPATPTVAAPAPMNLAAESMSDLGAEVERSWLAWAAAGLMLLAAARERRGERERRAMADILGLGLSCRSESSKKSL